jgi:hypothetical protein
VTAETNRPLITTRSRRRSYIAAQHGLLFLDAQLLLTEDQAPDARRYLIAPTGYPARDQLEANDLIGRDV